jgi:hypothetical protein
MGPVDRRAAAEKSEDLAATYCERSGQKPATVTVAAAIS